MQPPWRNEAKWKRCVNSSSWATESLPRSGWPAVWCDIWIRERTGAGRREEMHRRTPFPALRVTGKLRRGRPGPRRVRSDPRAHRDRVHRRLDGPRTGDCCHGRFRRAAASLIERPSGAGRFRSGHLLCGSAALCCVSERSRLSLGSLGSILREVRKPGIEDCGCRRGCRCFRRCWTERSR